MHAGRAPHLGEKHRAEFAGPDQGHSDRATGGFALQELGMKIQCNLRSVDQRWSGARNRKAEIRFDF